MKVAVKFLCFLGLVVIASSAAMVDGAGGCGKSSPDKEFDKLAPCEAAARNEKVAVSHSCCRQMKKIWKKPGCLCEVLLSDTLKAAGIKPEIAITIPKRCNIANRPVGENCGGYIVP